MPQNRTAGAPVTSTWSPSDAGAGLLPKDLSLRRVRFQNELSSRTRRRAFSMPATGRRTSTSCLFFADREPVGRIRVTISPRRTLHLRFNDLKEPAAVPRDTDFSSVFEAGRADHRAAHATGFAARRSEPVIDDRLRGGVSGMAPKHSPGPNCALSGSKSPCNAPFCHSVS